MPEPVDAARPVDVMGAHAELVPYDHAASVVGVGDCAADRVARLARRNERLKVRILWEDGVASERKEVGGREVY